MQTNRYNEKNYVNRRRDLTVLSNGEKRTPTGTVTRSGGSHRKSFSNLPRQRRLLTKTLVVAHRDAASRQRRIMPRGRCPRARSRGRNNKGSGEFLCPCW